MKRAQSNSTGPQTQRARRERLNRQLLGYTATAGAALAVGGTAGTANAGIVHDEGFTGPITVNSPSNTPIQVNIAGGATAQFSFIAGQNSSIPNDHYLAVKGLGGAQMLLASASDIWAKNLGRGARIGSAQGPWIAGGVSSGTLAFRGNGDIGGGSFLGKKGYIGVKFDVGPQTDYGWIKFQATSDASTGTILGWAYNDSGDPIRAGDTCCIPEPASLALWALGALSMAGVGVLRRWKKEA
jgi:hypothetical protein